MPTSLDVAVGIRQLSADPLSLQVVLQALTDAGKAAADAADAILAVQSVIADPAVATVEIPAIARNILGTYNNIADAVNVLTGKTTLVPLDPSPNKLRVHAPAVPPTPPSKLCVLPVAFESIITGAPSEYCLTVPHDLFPTIAEAVDSMTTTARDKLVSDLALAATQIEKAVSETRIPFSQFSLAKIF